MKRRVEGPYACVVADPPWQNRDQLPGKTRGASKQYKTMPTDAICRWRGFHDLEIAKDAVLIMWRLASMPQDALDVIKAWGFEVKSEFVWEKTTKTGKEAFGMGRQVRNNHEVAHIATRGRNIRLNASTRSRFRAPMPVHPPGHPDAGRLIHSAKPPVFLDIVERLYPGPRIELFARTRRPGWHAIGNELPPVDLSEAA